MQLFLVFFGLPLLGFDVAPWLAAGVGADLCTPAPSSSRSGAAASKPFRVASGSRGQPRPALPAADAPGDPAAGLAIARAPTVGFLVQLVKSTALTSIIGFVELTRTSNAINNATFEPFTVYGLVALIYFAMCFPLTRYARALERRRPA